MSQKSVSEYLTKKNYTQKKKKRKEKNIRKEEKSKKSNVDGLYCFSPNICSR